MPDRAPTAPRPGTTDAATDRRHRYMSGPAALLGGPANVIMQLGLPPVGRGIIESTVTSGRFDLHPRKRGKTTLTYLAVALLGTDEDRDAFRAAVDTSHRHVRSTERSPVRYNAFDPRLQLWVAACLYRGTADSVALLFGGIDEHDAEEMYADCARFGTTLQVRADMWPADRDAFREYWDSMLAEISFDDEVRRYLLDQVVDLGPYHPIQRVAFRRINRFFTTGYLPQQFRDELGLDWGPRRQRAFELVMRSIGRATAVLPTSWRLYPFEGYLNDMRERRAQGKNLV
ncbi:oxygenase MpaB family protein [Nocardia aurantia]|uniref:ER-bound oxygenase mpaB/mpaB'/Rubber oxygenase catalytic domain-containing protein n=1 Tax=Nocardia aurantia TaxID=2585199 RepID=A0A7K0DTT9_9NOCA|nr:oxygenase MpaB family protein [Nocardia aurantia]MQY29183.1 hypothetical protein [Nocardia aurantia]